VKVFSSKNIKVSEVIKSKKKNIYIFGNLGNDHEIEFPEIEIAIFHEIKSFAKLIMRSKLAFFRRSKLFAKLIRKLKRPLGP